MPPAVADAASAGAAAGDVALWPKARTTAA